MKAIDCNASIDRQWVETITDRHSVDTITCAFNFKTFHGKVLWAVPTLLALMFLQSLKPLYLAVSSCFSCFNQY
ncbi:hypothetical protein [Nostoc sp.]|uniref:hypothetical protein n=1 Tax=Nostoc sp. TaxID=1180 RepID=UPI002FF48839